jgi:hypothetical protein
VAFKVSPRCSPSHLHPHNLLFYQENEAQQKADSQHFLPVPGSHNGAMGTGIDLLTITFALGLGALTAI